MRLRRLALAVGLTGAFSTNTVFALGLGEIKLQSALNQPLQAEVKLLQVRDLSENEILVNLASRDEFQRVGLDRPFFLTDLRFEVNLNSPSGPVIEITSRNPVREPYLNFLLESQWPSGRIMREYTVLLDLPVFSEQAAAPVVSARTSRPQTSAAAPRSAPAAQSGTGGVPGDVYGPVSATDTLWNIALEVRPGSQYSVHKTMLAIQRLNPEAFINGNINLLRRGQVLRVPRAAEIDAVTQQQAIQEVAFQNRKWSGDETATGAPLDATGRTDQAGSRPAAVEGRLKVAGDDMSAASAQRGTGSGAGASSGPEDLQGELAVSLEELDKSRRENADLQQRVQDLEEQIKTMERLVEVSNQELRALQLQGDAESATAVPSESGSGPTASKPAAESPAAQPASVVRPAAAKERGLVDILTDNILYIGAALVAILAAVLLLLRRREEPETELVAESAVAVPPAVPKSATDSDLDDALLVEEAESLFEEEPTAVADDEAAVERAPVESQTDDVVGEADIYIAYGKLDQAREMLQKALDADTDNNAVRLKLMEVHAEANELDAFDEQYAQIAASGDDVSIARADDLRMHFADQEQVADPYSQEFSSAFDLDDTSTDDTVAEVPKDSEAEESSLDLVVDDHVDDDSTEEFEFSLDLEEDEDTTVEDFAAFAEDDSFAKAELDLDESTTASDDQEFTLDFENIDKAQDADDIVTAEERGESDFELDFPETSSDELAADLDAEDDSFELDLDAEASPDLDFELDADELDLEAETNRDFEQGGSEDVTLSYQLEDTQLEDTQLDPVADDLEGDAAESEADADSHFDLQTDDEVDLEELDRELEDLSGTAAAEPESDPFAADDSLQEPVTEVDEQTSAKPSKKQSDEELFNAALADLPSPEDVLADSGEDSAEGLDEEFDFLADTDESATKLDLARAYIDMGDHDGASDILDEVLQEGNEEQRRDAEELKSRLG